MADKEKLCLVIKKLSSNKGGKLLRENKNEFILITNSGPNIHFNLKTGRQTKLAALPKDFRKGWV